MKACVRSICIAASMLAMSSSAYADINIGVVVSLTGAAASLGGPARDTVALWPTEIAGQHVNVTLLDDASDPTAAAVAVRKLIEDKKVDVIVGPSITPTSLAALQVAGEMSTPILTLAGSGAVISPPDGPRRWAFKMPPSEAIQLNLIFEQMKRLKETKLAVVAVANAYGEVFLDVARKLAPQNGIEIVDVERFNPTDTSFVAQALKIGASHADATFIAAVGTPGALPHVELRKRNLGGTIYQTQAIANPDFLRVGGKDVDGCYFPVSPLLVAEQLPDSNPVKKVALEFVEKYEGKYGANTRSLFGATAWDQFILLEHAVPKALKVAKPGTVEFRTALRDALEETKDLVVSQGVYTLSSTDHNGADKRSQVLVEIDNGKWRYVP